MTAPEFARYLADYAGSSGAPIKAGTTVLSVRSTPFGYRVETNWFGWETRAVVIATGQSDVPRIPGFRAATARVAASDNLVAVPQSRVSCRKAACWWSAHLQPACSLRRRSGNQAGMSCSRRGATRGCRGATGDATHGGGSNASACSTRRRMKCRTCTALAPCPRFSSWAGRTGARSISAHCGMRACAFSVAPSAPRATSLHLRDDLAETTGAAQAALERLLARIDIVADASGIARADDACPPPAVSMPRRPRSIWRPRASARCCGRPVIGGITRGSRSRCWMRPAR